MICRIVPCNIGNQGVPALYLLIKTIRNLYMYLTCRKSDCLFIFKHATNRKIYIFILQVHFFMNVDSVGLPISLT